MQEEFVTVVAGGANWSAFRRVMVRAAFNEGARSFHIDIAAEPVPSAAFAAFGAGQQISILFTGDLVLAGYVDRYQPKIGEHNQAEIAVSGRSKSQDLIDSSGKHKTGRFDNKTIVEIMKEVNTTSAEITTDQELEKIPFYQLVQGETIFRLGEKLARSQGLTLTGDPDGKLRVTKAGSQRNGPIIEGQNMKIGEADHNWSGRHSKIIVRGQRPFGHGEEALEIEAIATDSAVKRERPVIVIADDDTDKKRAKKRANTRRDREAGNSLKANVTLEAFHDDGGKLWTPGALTFLESPFLAIQQDMLIESATYTQDRDSGSLCVLGLVDPRAYGGKGGKGGSAGDGWDTSAGGEE